ncbi:transcriptional regulator [Escherichia coli]|nr:transcriptional regulator [Escherichia coli]SQZ61168.1 transcriptional regulator [Escherichia coli]SRY96286.1 transcriptional regulator [Escherichia coli]
MFMQIDRRIDINGNSYLVRCEERPNGEWRVYDIDRKINISTMNKDTAFDEWWICPYISRHLLSLNPLLACCRRYSRGER